VVSEQQNISVGAQEKNFAAGENQFVVVATEEQNISLMRNILFLW